MYQKEDIPILTSGDVEWTWTTTPRWGLLLAFQASALPIRLTTPCFGDRERTWTSIGFTLHLLSGQTSYQLEYPTILCVSVGVCTREIWLMATLSKPSICNCLATVYLILRHFHSLWGFTLLSHQSGATRHLAMREGLEPSMVLPTAVFRTARLPIITPHHFWSNSALLQQHDIFILCEDSATLTSVNILTCGGVERTWTSTPSISVTHDLANRPLTN